MQFFRWAGCSNTHVASGRNVNTAGRRAGPDAKRQARAAGDIANEEVGFVAGDGPRLRCKSAAGILFVPHGGGVNCGHMPILSLLGRSAHHPSPAPALLAPCWAPP